jgi:hypothetical protein
MPITKRNKNTDVVSGFLIPENSQIQGQIFEKVKPFMNFMRYHQLIKCVRYNISIEYYPDELIPTHKMDIKKDENTKKNVCDK